MKNYKFTLNEIVENIVIDQLIILNNGLKLIVKSKPYKNNNGMYYIDCLKENIIKTFSLTYIYEKELVKYDSKGLFEEKSFIQIRYLNKCWKCQYAIDSNYCERCDICGWYICNECKSCRREMTQRIKGICNSI